jgi:hypothetical protein
MDMNMEENPFESLSKGLHKNLNLVFEGQKSEHPDTPALIRVASALSNGTLPTIAMGTVQKRTNGPAFAPLSDQFVQSLAVFPLAGHVVINKYGAYIPQSIFGNQTEITYEQERSADGTIRVSVHPTLNTTSRSGRPQIGSARGLIWMSDDFDEPLEDFIDYMQ